MIYDIFMPALSSTMTEGKIVSWTKSPGDKVEKGETVLVVESDKADMDVESFNEGYLAAILVPAGEEAPVGATLGLVVETEAEIAEAQAKAGSGGGSSAAPTATPAPQQPEPVAIASATAIETTPAPSSNGNGKGSGRIIASPRAKKLAKELKVDLATIAGTGPHGRIVAADIESAAGKPVTASIAAPSAPAPKTSPAPTPRVTSTPSVPVGQTVPLTTFQKALVQNMVAAMAAPTFRVGYTITTDGLDQLYKQIKGKGVTMTALLAKAVALALKKHPIVNASYTDQGIIYHKDVNIALAVAMPDGGLITPVLQNADQVDIYSLSRRWKELVERARAKQLQPEEYSTGTFTISNLGMFGVDRFDAILPPGQGGILAVGASRPQVVANEEGLIGTKRQMAVNVTCDHRVIYGAHAAAFLKDLAVIIEENAQSLTM
ncbi:dihydrolipoamide acetyltransferase component (E2) of pyruvate dehydrogenase complex [Synechocystis sp. PCC 6803]|uniref:Dihydrolipoamide acetyltransferase component of pyruvate dehydrogenase complex n=1 Tax=Synechocystis sp. (strain ATCC 27184 / PCC 6803 / Kazusa) TaxID=1111708 RepID=P74510_SYNY3|nr:MULTISPECIES: dihydrolipoamide acetyltransferase family protein [unclassified Synechocystis]BAM54655.1 branched-chain alpha-keto acid dehydrogenase E2 [Synechocystis sp. PCC 6803] [Bacillus subtilis BEST7613]AGF52302.1 dihydrolipoamide acetyltransferase component (E2) of pyruvate dehydrogenase complex [Synechocystis sp. PCC 6803]ALJ68245.1 branched-chain alpha-keto acid dehydrogenase subunit E2 [Synechocystis sp. PCC 6803]AVP90086.1 2-oxo acid dehydrogenase subunit E2 [Synechocystis sp. IPPA